MIWKAARYFSRDGLYFMLHEEKVGNEAKRLAIMADANPDICWAAGLTHDLGCEMGDQEYEWFSKVPSDIFRDVGIREVDSGEIIHAIINHANQLPPGRTPIGTLVVSHAHAGSFFKHYRSTATLLYHLQFKGGAPTERLDEVKENMLESCVEHESRMTDMFLRSIYEDDLVRFRARVENLELSSLLYPGRY